MKILLAVLFLIWITSCNKEVPISQSFPVPVNYPPVAKAGADQVITLPTDSILLTGIASFDVGGKIILYSWRKISGPSSFDIINPDSSKTIVNRLVQGEYQFELSVKDNSGLPSKDTIQINVIRRLFNQPPVARAGQDRTIRLPLSPWNNNLSASGSFDPDGNIVSYSWKKLAGPDTFNIVNPLVSDTYMLNLAAGSYQIELTVNDNAGAFAKDTIIILVLPEVTPDPANGRVQFWTKIAIGDYPDYNEVLSVTINNETQIMTWYYGDGRSDCNNGLAEGRFHLAAGIYTWKAKYASDSITGTISITAGACVLQEIKF